MFFQKQNLSTPQWIRQPEAAWVCVVCVCKYVLGHSRVSEPLNLRHFGFLTSPHASPTCRRRRLNSYRLLRRSTPGPPPIPWAHLKEAEGRAGTVRSNQRSSNTLYCRVNVRVKLGIRRDSCSSSLINFVLNLSKLFLVNRRMSSSYDLLECLVRRTF